MKLLMCWQTRISLIAILLVGWIWFLLLDVWWWIWPAWVAAVILATLIVEMRPVKRLLNLEEAKHG